MTSKLHSNPAGTLVASETEIHCLTGSKEDFFAKTDEKQRVQERRRRRKRKLENLSNLQGKVKILTRDDSGFLTRLLACFEGFIYMCVLPIL